MKKITLIAMATFIALSATSFIAFKKKATAPMPVAAQNPIWFDTIEIADGITVEFEYGNRLQVYVEGDKDLVNKLALVLDHNTLKAKADCGMPGQGVKIKVVTPVLISLASQGQITRADCAGNRGVNKPAGKQVIIKPLLMQGKIFQASPIEA